MTEFELLASTVVARNEQNLLDYGPDEQITHAVQQLERFARTTPIRPVHGITIDLAGFGEAPVYFENTDDRYLLLSEVADQLGMPIWKACYHARQQHLFAIEDQRQVDEERGDGRLGYDCLRDYVDLGFSFVADDPEAKPDRGGRRWSSYGDWLISTDRLPLLLLCSPWGREFMDNVHDHFSIGLQHVFGDKLRNVPAYDADGNPIGTAADIFRTDLTEKEALRKARRGPAGAIEEDG